MISALIWIVVSLASSGSALFVIGGGFACLVGGTIVAYGFARLRPPR